MNPSYAAMEAAFTVLILIAAYLWVVWAPTLATLSNEGSSWGEWWYHLAGWGSLLAVGFTLVALVLAWLISICTGV